MLRRKNIALQGLGETIQELAGENLRESEIRKSVTARRHCFSLFPGAR